MPPPGATYVSAVDACVNGSDRRNDAGRQHRVAARRILERRVGVPEAVPEPVDPAAMVGGRDLAALVQVRDVDERVVVEAVEAERRRPRLPVELAVQALGEGELLRVRERLVAEHEDRVLIHPGPDLGERLGVEHLAEVDRADLGHEGRVERAEPEGHG